MNVIRWLLVVSFAALAVAYAVSGRHLNTTASVLLLLNAAVASLASISSEHLIREYREQLKRRPR